MSSRPREPISTPGTAGATPRTASEAPKDSGAMLRMAREFLQRKGVEEWRLEAELLVAHALSLDRMQLFLALDRPVTAEEVDRARDLLVRRGRREPTAYIVGRREFYKRDFRVGRGVLVPRPETELLVDRAREIGDGAALAVAAEQPRPDRKRFAVADVGTGSGCIAITCALEMPAARVVAIDRSPSAVMCARANAVALDDGTFAERVTIVEGDGIEELLRAVEQRGARFDLVLSNPPYVRKEDAATLAPEVRDYEPAEALFAPDGDPDRWARVLLDVARRAIAPGGALLVELGSDQSSRVEALARERGFAPRIHVDLARIPRVLEVRV